jgi:hypothetical protein
MREQEEGNKAGRREWTNVGATLAVALRRREGNKPRRGEMCITDGEAQRNRRYKRAESPIINSVGHRPTEWEDSLFQSPVRAQSNLSSLISPLQGITKEQYRDSARTASTAEIEPRPNKDKLIMNYEL